MKAVLRLGLALVAGASALAPSGALAQAVPPKTSTPATDAIGPSELQNFSLKGTVTQRSDQPATVPQAAQRRPRAAQTQAAPDSVQSAPAAPSATSDRSREQRIAANDSPTAAAPKPARALAPDTPKIAPSSVVENQQPPPASAPPLPAASSAAPGFTPAPASAALPIAPEHKFPILPWLLAALALGAGGAFLFWRNRPREAFAGGPQVDSFVAPEPVRQPAAPQPAPRPSAPPPIPGLVSTRLRPWIEIGFHPLRCVLDQDKAAIEFELELFNSGSAPARGVLAEAALFNAGPHQDQEIGSFFARPVGEGDRIPIIPPLKRVALKTQVAIGRDQVQAYELAGRKVFVPLIAFNTLYRWANGDGQTSASYLLGIGAGEQKMAPFRLDLGPRIFRGLGSRALPDGVRR